MAQLDATPLPPWTSAQSRAQLAAVAWLRWRIFVHSFRYKGKKRTVAKWIVIAIARILVWGIIAVFALGPIVACAATGYYAASHHQLSMLSTLTWAVFTVSLFISINISPATIGFDLTPLLRFPIDFRRYLLIRLFFGLFAIPTVVANLSLAAAAIGIGVARPELFLWSALVLGVFALHNVFFIRMIFAWVDRWMATRRAREIFGGLVLFLSLGFQLAVSGGRGHRGETFATLARLFAPLHPLMQYLPPGLAAQAIVDRAHSAITPAYTGLLGLIAFAIASLAILAMRLKREFRGENLSEAGKRAPGRHPHLAPPSLHPQPSKNPSRLQRPPPCASHPPSQPASRKSSSTSSAAVPNSTV